MAAFWYLDNDRLIHLSFHCRIQVTAAFADVANIRLMPAGSSPPEDKNIERFVYPPILSPYDLSRIIHMFNVVKRVIYQAASVEMLP